MRKTNPLNIKIIIFESYAVYIEEIQILSINI